MIKKKVIRKEKTPEEIAEAKLFATLKEKGLV